MKISKIAKLLISIIVIVAAGSGVSLLLKNKIEAGAKKIYEARSLLQVLENRDENHLLLKANYPAVREGLPILRKALPKEDGIEMAVSDLEALAAKTSNAQNLVFDSLSGAQTIGGVKGVNFSTSLVGNFGTFAEYFKKLRSLPYFIEITSVSINNDTGVFNNNSRLNLKAKLYIKK